MCIYNDVTPQPIKQYICYVMFMYICIPAVDTILSLLLSYTSPPARAASPLNWASLSSDTAVAALPIYCSCEYDDTHII